MKSTYFDTFPPYTGGKTTGEAYNAGPMLADDREHETEEDCPVQLFTETTQEAYMAYLETCRKEGYTLLYEHHSEAVDAAQITGNGRTMYLYFTRACGEVRMAADPIGVPVPAISYTVPAELAAQSADIVQYGLYYDPKNGCTDTTVNCGMLYILRLADNSLFMIDGGHKYQCSAEAVEGLYDFLHTLTGTCAGEPIRIAAWYFTHAHDDHMAACVRLLRQYPGEFQIERVLMNYPSRCTGPGGYSADNAILKETLRTLCPDALYLKLHTGQTFTLANASFEVLYTHEDAVQANDPAHYPFRDFNCTSNILKMTTGGGTVLWLGDTNVETEALVTRTVPRSMWKADVVQIAHHCFNYLTTLYAWIDADYAMLPNSCFGGHTPENTPKLADVLEHLASPENIWYEDRTTGFRFENGAYRVILEQNRIGGAYDGTDWEGRKTE